MMVFLRKEMLSAKKLLDKSYKNTKLPKYII